MDDLRNQGKKCLKTVLNKEKKKNNNLKNIQEI